MAGGDFKFKESFNDIGKKLSHNIWYLMNFKYKTNETQVKKIPGENKALHATGHVNENWKTYM